MNRITESVGAWGVSSSDRTFDRMTLPRSGDIVRWPSGALGRVWTTPRESGHLADDHQIHVCEELGSAFLYKDGSVSISGGPFRVLNADGFRPTYETWAADFWNWGDRMPGAGQGVYYRVHRPVFAFCGDLEALPDRLRVGP